jgi:hypothetical protein
MADTKITALTAITTVDPAVDVLPIVDISDTTMAASGTTKKITSNQILGAGGTATLASATISGDLTVNTNVLKVDSTNDRVGVKTATPAAALHVASGNIRLDDGFQLEFGGSTNSVAGSNATNTVQIYTNNVERYNINSTGVSTWSVGGSTAMTLNSTGLGVGTTDTTNGRLNIRAGTAATGNSAFFTNIDGTYNPYLQIQHSSSGIKLYTNSSFGGDAGNLTIGCGTATNALIVNGSGNVGVGVTPSAWVSGSPAVQLKYNSSIWAFTDNSLQLNQNAYFDGAWKYINSSSLASSNYYQEGGNHRWRTAAAGTAGNAITWTTPMTLDASGNLLVGTTSAFNSARVSISGAGGSGGIVTAIQNDNDTYFAINFRNSGGTSCGSISCTTSATAFNLSSDYRLKESVQPLTGGLTRINALKPSIYKWKVDGKSGEGFIAHELADVVPLAVTGEKDAVNEDGSIKPQQVDFSKIVPILVAAIKELAAEVNALKNA